VFVEEYPVPSSISMWQQGMRGSYMPPQSQVGVRHSNFVASQYAPSVAGRQSTVPQGWAPRNEMVEMDDFRPLSMVQSQIAIPNRLPRGSIAMSQTHSRYGGSDVGRAYLPSVEPRGNLLGDEFADFDSTMRSPDESLAREVVRNVLKEVDINTTTTKQVRALVESKLGMGVRGQVSPEQRKALDDMIDKELEEMI